MERQINWTNEQELAIRTVGSDVLLTASAGSGKTAVLAQRCIYLLTEAPRPCNIDELLVLTFTESAAAEMRSRIAEELRRLNGSTGYSARLQRQLLLLDKAQIGTVHSFCNSVLREFFYHLPLDGTYEILDGDDADLLKLQIATELFEERYARIAEAQDQSADVFPGFVQAYGAGGNDRSLIDLLVRLHNFIDTLYDQEAWLRSWRQNLPAAERLSTEDQPDVENLTVVRRRKRVLQSQLGRVIDRLEYARNVIPHYPALSFYADYIQNNLMSVFCEIKKALAAGDLTRTLKLLHETEKLPRAPTRPKDLSSEDIAPVKDLIDQAKKEFQQLQRQYAVETDAVIRQLHCTEPFVDLLVQLRGEFAERYSRSKRRQNVLDFADLERLCLTVLRGPDGPTEAALQLRRRFRYILVDEYQDISPLQEAIIQCLRDERRETAEYSETADKPGHTDKNTVGGNLFMVGDVKQSIYGFRQAEPDIFLEKFRRFTPLTPGAKSELALGPKRIDLNRNFRSRRGIINAVNYIFSRCMTLPFAGIDYYRDARLVHGADFYDAADEADAIDSNDNKAIDQPVPALEIHLLDRSINITETSSANSDTDAAAGETEDLDATRREALIVAQRIRRMVGLDQSDGKAEFDVVDPHSGQKRPVQYRDIVVLLRSMKMRAEPWSEVFGRMGIPVHAELSRGYFVATEIQDMICLLQLLDNPRRDIAMASVLRSELVALNESQLAAIRLHCPDGSFYNAISRYIEDGPDETLKDSLAGFFQRLDRWRDLARRGNLAELIWHIYRETDLLAYVSGLPDGRQRHRNLLYLHDCARRFGSFARQGLARFLRFIDKLREEEGDFGPAPILSEADNVVRIISVHKSKGLEFPVVIVADLARRFNLRDTSRSILFESFPDLSESCSVGLRIVDSISRDSWPTIAHNVIADELKQRRLAEEMRILYVAFTRSRERLLLVASADLANRRKQWQSWHNERGRLPEFLLRSALCPIDWLGLTLAAHPDMRSFFQQELGLAEPAPSSEISARFAVTTYPAEQIREIIQATALFSDRPQPPASLDELISCDTSTSTVPTASTDPQVTKVIDRLNWRYPHETLSRLRARGRVSDLKHLIDLEQDPEFTPDLARQKQVGKEASQTVTITEPFKKRPAFLADQPSSPTAAEVGSWTHLLLEKLDLAASLDESGLAGQLREIVGRGFLTTKQADYIDLSAVAHLFTSELGRKMLTHYDRLYREWPFTLAVPVGEIYRCEAESMQQPFSPLSAADKNELVLVRGVIDCLFETDSGWVIVDYKTDRIASDQCDERAAFYSGQMLLYRRAVQTIIRQPVAEMVLYFLNPAIAVPLSS